MVTSWPPRAAPLGALASSRLRAHPERAILALVLLLGALLRLWLLSRDVPTLDSDEAVIGLMALHLQHGEWSVFYWGQHYMGSLEAVVAAPLLWLFGPSPLTLRLAPLLIGLGGVVTVYLLGKRLFSARVGLVSAALLALGPAFFLVLSVRAYGGYVETLLLGNLLLLLVLYGAAPVGRRTRVTALVGLLAGVALWTDVLVAPYLLASGAIWWWQRRADLLQRRNWLALTGGFLLGVAPAIVYNLAHGGATLSTILGLSVVGSGSAHTTPAALLHNLWLIVTVSLPILVGAAFGGTQAAGYTPDSFMAAAAAPPLISAVALVLVALALLVMGSGALRIARGWRTLRAPIAATAAPRADDAAPLDPALIRRQGEAALLLVGLCYVAAFCLTKQLTVFATPRYLFPLYSLTPLLVAWSAHSLASLRGHGFAPMNDQHLRAGAIALVLALLTVWNVTGAASLTPPLTAARDHGVWIAGRDESLVRLLRAHHVRTVISNDYWEGLRLTFESDETVIAVMVTPQGHPGFNRYAPYVTRGLADPRPAYLELTGTPEAHLDLTRLRLGQLPGYISTVVGDYTLLVPA